MPYDPNRPPIQASMGPYQVNALAIPGMANAGLAPMDYASTGDNRYDPSSDPNSRIGSAARDPRVNPANRADFINASTSQVTAMPGANPVLDAYRQSNPQYDATGLERPMGAYQFSGITEDPRRRRRMRGSFGGQGTGGGVFGGGQSLSMVGLGDGAAPISAPSMLARPPSTSSSVSRPVAYPNDPANPYMEPGGPGVVARPNDFRDAAGESVGLPQASSSGGFNALARRPQPVVAPGRLPGTPGLPAAIPLKDGGRVKKRKRAPQTYDMARVDGENPRFADGGRTSPYLSYDEYNRVVGNRIGTSVGSEGDTYSSNAPHYSESQWNALSPAERYAVLQQNTNNTGGEAGDYRANAQDEARFRAQYGNAPWADNASGRSAGEYGRNIIYGYGDMPTIYDRPASEYMIDPSRVVRDPDGRWMMESDNIGGDWMAQAQATADRKWNQGIARNAAVLAAAGIGGALAGPGMAGGESAAMTAGVDAAESAGTLGLNAAGTGVAPYVPAGVESAAGAMPFEAGYPGNTPMTGEPVPFESGYPTDVGLEPGPDFTPMDRVQAPQLNPLSADPTSGARSWMTPQNFDRAARVAGTAASALGRGGSGSSAAGTPLPDIGAGIGLPPVGAPGGGNGLVRNAPAGNALVRPGATVAAPGADAGGSYDLSTFDPNAFVARGGTGNWEAARGRFAPIESMIFDEAAKAGSESEQQAAAGRARADVAQRFAQNRQRAKANLVAQGMNPEDPRGVAGEMDRLSRLDEAKASVGGQNAARLGEKERGFGTRVQAAAVGNAAAGQALQADNVGLQRDLANARIGADMARSRAELGVRMGEGALDRGQRRYETDINNDYRYADLGSRDALGRDTNSIARENAITNRGRVNADIARGTTSDARQASIDRGRGVGTVITGARDIYGFGHDVGFWKDGHRVSSVDVGLEPSRSKRRPKYRDGARVERRYEQGARVRGPGTSTSDSVHARLSDKEGVLNAEGMELLDATEPGKFEALNDAGLKIRAARQQLTANMADVGLGD